MRAKLYGWLCDITFLIEKLFRKQQEIITLPIPNPVIPESETITLTRKEFIDALKALGIVSLTGSSPIDSIVRLAAKSELDRIAPSLVYPAEWYINDLWDCDDYGLQAQLDAGRKFEVSVRLGLGNVNVPNLGFVGYHGFAITLDRELNLWLLEPNAALPWAGVWFKQTENSYVADKVFI